MKNRVSEVLSGTKLPRIITDHEISGYNTFHNRISSTVGINGTIPIHLKRGVAMKTVVVLSPGEDGYIIAACPSLPGCISQGRNRDEAIENIKEAIEAYRETLNDLGLNEHEVVEVEV